MKNLSFPGTRLLSNGRVEIQPDRVLAYLRRTMPNSPDPVADLLGELSRKKVLDSGDRFLRTVLTAIAEDDQ